MKRLFLLLTILALLVCPISGNTATSLKFSGLPAGTSILSTDIIPFEYDPPGTTKKITFGNLAISLGISAGTDGTYGVSLSNNTSTFAPSGSYTYGYSFIGGYPYAYFGSANIRLATLTGAETLTAKGYPAYASSGTTDQGTKDINIDGLSYNDYTYSPLAGTAGVYTPVITSAPGSGSVRYITLHLGGGTNGITTVTWTNVTFMGSAGAAAVTASKTSSYACIIPNTGNAKCSIIAENY